jgi:hypothetical protein
MSTGGLCLAFLLAFVVGCSKPSEVTGTVTLNGAPLEKGQITFQPVGQGRPEGGEVVNGKYVVKGLAAGKYIAGVISTSAVMGPENMDDAVKAAAKLKPEPINPKTGGNNIEVDITGSNQTFDMKLISTKK